MCGRCCRFGLGSGGPGRAAAGAATAGWAAVGWVAAGWALAGRAAGCWAAKGWAAAGWAAAAAGRAAAGCTTAGRVAAGCAATGSRVAVPRRAWPQRAWQRLAWPLLAWPQPIRLLLALSDLLLPCSTCYIAYKCGWEAPLILIRDCYVLMLCAGCFTRLDPCAGGSELMLNVSLTDRRREAPTDCANLMLYRNQAKNILY